MKIGIELNEENFEYDIYSLIKAFYPKEEVGRECGEDVTFVVRVTYGEESIEVSIGDKKKMVSIQGAHRKDVKSRLKKILYEILKEQTNKTLPWGTLTGIRPTKIPFAMLEEGKTEQDITAYMKEEYLASEEKVALSIGIAKRERDILREMDYQNGYSLYVGIPFCPTRCLYCSFTSYPLSVWKKRVDEYVEVLCKEIRHTAQWMKEKPLHTVYIGGGTPTTLEPPQMELLLSTLKEAFDFSAVREFTVEAGRPDSVTREKLQVLKEYGVSRISVNPQTMKQETLDLIGREHTVEQTKEAFCMARECGFENINMDLITGLPGETASDMEHTMKELSLLKPDSITVHALALKRASRLHEQKEQYAEYESIHNDEIAAMVECYAASMGQTPYYLYRQKNMTGNLENVGYSALDKAGIYNILIMEEKQTILAVGAGATTKLVNGERIERIDNVKSVEQYIERIDEMIERKAKWMNTRAK